jgi:hypothetical protein
MAGQLHDAQSYYAKALHGVVHLGHVQVCESVLCELAEVALTRGEAMYALRLAGARSAVARAGGATPGAEARERMERVVSSARTPLCPMSRYGPGRQDKRPRYSTS